MDQETHLKLKQMHKDMLSISEKLPNAIEKASKADDLTELSRLMRDLNEIYSSSVCIQLTLAMKYIAKPRPDFYPTDNL